MKGSLLAALTVMAASLLSGCNTMKGASDAMMNLVGPSTQSRVIGRYIENAEVTSALQAGPAAPE